MLKFIPKTRTATTSVRLLAINISLPDVAIAPQAKRKQVRARAQLGAHAAVRSPAPTGGRAPLAHCAHRCLCSSGRVPPAQC
eukprot:SAG22_NODE_9237_length_601_cov_1.314741_1_plen_82_part_00